MNRIKGIGHPRYYEKIILPEQTILKWFKQRNAYWIHNGNPESPHAKLTRGLCSNGYFDCMRILCDPVINEILANQLANKLKKCGVKHVDWVIGSDHSAATFSYEVAKAFMAKHDFTEKDPDDPERKKMLWKRLTIPKDSIVLDVEELITTSSTFREVRRAIEQGNNESIHFLPVVGAIIHRPPKLPIKHIINEQEIKIISLIEKKIWTIEQEKCPLCQIGSPRYRPKTNWEKLTGNLE